MNMWPHVLLCICGIGVTLLPSFVEATGHRGTVVHVTLDFKPPGAGLGRAVGRALQPLTHQHVREDLRRFKQLMEAGEVPRTDGQPAGRRSALAPSNPF